MKKHRWCAWDSNPGRQDGRHRQIHWAMAAPHKQMFAKHNYTSLKLSFSLFSHFSTFTSSTKFQINYNDSINNCVSCLDPVLFWKFLSVDVLSLFCPHNGANSFPRIVKGLLRLFDYSARLHAHQWSPLVEELEGDEVSAKWSNKFGYCPSWTVSLVLSFNKATAYRLGLPKLSSPISCRTPQLTILFKCS